MAPERYGLHKELVDRFGAKGDALHMFVAASLALAVSGFGAYLFNLRYPPTFREKLFGKSE